STLPLILKSQKYYPFPDSNAVWQVSEWCSDPPNCGLWVSYCYHYGNDTVINSKTYKAVIRSHLQHGGTLNCCGLYPITGDYIGGVLRQDTLDKKVFLYDVVNEQDTLLYDFDLDIGDTLKGFLGLSVMGTTLEVVSIDSLLVGNFYRKRINFDTLNNPPGVCFLSIIEGIGSTAGLFEKFKPNNFIIPYGNKLNCFSENGITLYNSACPEYAVPCEHITLSIPLINDNNIKIYPNPVSDYFTISTRECDIPLKVEVYSISGAKLDEQAIYMDKTRINISSYKKGTYIIRIQNKHNHIIKSEKIILR
ncbi:MAG: T9SS type A sorting domain-containing protein, partial [Bacteroidales bacterium]|nr:T9SS type A sorting domain-containing protein [Bacteroidales bacterium]